jgi:hypothetical protein
MQLVILLHAKFAVKRIQIFQIEFPKISEENKRLLKSGIL